MSDKLLVPVEVIPKMKGMRVQAHVVDGKAKILAGQGEDVTAEFPEIAKDLERYLDSVFDGEIAGKPATLHVNDVLVYQLHREGKPMDLHGKPLSERRAVRVGISPAISINVLKGLEVKTDDDLKDAIEKAGEVPGSDGAIVRPLNSLYPLDGNGFGLVVPKKLAIEAEVMEVHRGRNPEEYNLLCAVRNLDGNQVPVGKAFDVSFEETEGHGIRPRVGAVVSVLFDRLDRFTDPRTGQEWYNWTNPEVTESYQHDHRADLTLIASILSKQSDGEAGEKPVPSRYRIAFECIREGMIRELQTEEEYLAENYPLLHDLDEAEMDLLRAGMSEDDLSQARRGLLSEAKTVKWALTRSMVKGASDAPVARFELFVDSGGLDLRRWEFDQNPLFSDMVSSAGSTVDHSPPGGGAKNWLVFEGQIPPEHGMNPGKAPMIHEILDRGVATVLEGAEDFMVLEMNGKRLTGCRALKRDNQGSDTWSFGVAAGTGEK